jgi:hypothetical protein
MMKFWIDNEERGKVAGLNYLLLWFLIQPLTLGVANATFIKQCNIICHNATLQIVGFLADGTLS